MTTTSISYAECTARERLAHVLDAGSFHEWLPPAERLTSPHLAQLGVPTTLHPSGDVLVGFTEATARAFQLVHVLLHELGHHRDRMTSRRRVECGRGEGFAEAYAVRHGAEIWTRYADAFGW